MHLYKHFFLLAIAVMPLFYVMSMAAENTQAQAKSTAQTQTQSQKKYAFWISFDKKIIYVDSLGLPKSDNVASVMRLLPELLARPGESLTTNYDVKINGMSLGNIYDVAMEELQITDVDRIEVSESPMSTYGNNGQGGSIDIILREKSSYKEDKSDDNFWGTASLGARYQTKLMPYLQLSYKTKKYIIQGLTLGELDNHSITSTKVMGNLSSQTDDKERERNNFLGAYMQWKPTAKDAFEFKFMESYNYLRNRQDTKQLSENPSYATMADTSHVTLLRVLAKYQHKFSSRLILELESQYSYQHTKDDSRNTNELLINKNDVNFLSGTANLTYRLLNGPRNNYADVKIGADYNFTNDDKGYLYIGPDNQNDGTLGTKGRSSYVMPYLKWESKFGRFLMQFQGELQTFGFRINEADNGISHYHHNDFTGSLILEQQIGTPHHLRLLVTRKIQRPGLSQVYPFPIFLPSRQLVVIGNSELLPMLSHEISLDYISRYNFGRHKFTFDVNVSYQHVTDIINTFTLPLTLSDQITQYNAETYLNSGKANVLSGNVMVFYKYNTLSVSFTGNVYHKHQTEDYGTKTSNTYYNLAIMPAIDLPSGWNCSLYMAYHSSVVSTESKLGECAYTQLNIGKRFGRCNVYFYQKSAFTGDVTDVTYGDFESSPDVYTTHPLVSSSIGVGVQYQF